jgi:CRP-like cAMP-binding protein
MDEQLVLTAQTLRLNPNIMRADVSGASFVVKNSANRKYLTISAEQWNLLRNFSNPATVPDVLRAVILTRSSLPLREYYELVLKALRAGILKVDRQSTGDTQGLASRWAVTLGPQLPLILTWLSAVVALVFLFIRPFPWPYAGEFQALEALGNVVIGWILLAAGVTLGQVLAASVLRGGGGEIYEPKFHWLRPVPYFGVNLEDACMCDRLTQTAVASVRLFPVLATAAVLWWFKPEWGTLHVLALLIMMRPFDGSAPTILLSTVCRGQVLDTQKNFQFSLNQKWQVQFKASVGRVSLGYVAARLCWGLGWVALVVYACLLAAHMSVGELIDGKYLREVAWIFGLVSGAAMLAYFGPPITRYVYSRVRNYFRRNRTEWKRWRLNSVAPVPEEQIARMMAESLLFRRLPPAERAALSACGQTRFHKAWTIIHQFTDQPKSVSMILSGRVALYRRLKSGRGERLMVLKEGDVFGAHAMLDPDRQQVQIRALTPVLVLSIPIRDFERRAVTPIGVPLANNLAQKVPFLRELSFCENWHPQAVARFTQIASMIRYNSGELIVTERQDSQQFFLIYEGRVAVRREGRVRTKLRSGAFFGEISLLQNSASISDVIALEETRCLTISKSDFLRFVTHNPHVAIQLEHISSKRLGRPVFPCNYRSFDA